MYNDDSINSIPAASSLTSQGGMFINPNVLDSISQADEASLIEENNKVPEGKELDIVTDPQSVNEEQGLNLDVAPVLGSEQPQTELVEPIVDMPGS